MLLKSQCLKSLNFKIFIFVIKWAKIILLLRKKIISSVTNTSTFFLNFLYLLAIIFVSFNSVLLVVLIKTFIFGQFIK
jgi:hypothetical protein